MTGFDKRSRRARKRAIARAKSARKQADKRGRRVRKHAKGARKAAREAGTRTWAIGAGATALVAMAIAAARKALAGGDRPGQDAQRYSSEPDNLPNTADRPAGSTPVPGPAPAAVTEGGPPA